METLCKIRDIYRAITEFEHRFQEQYELGLNEAMLLCTLSEAGQSTSGEIAELLSLSQSNTSKVISSIEKKGLVKREIGERDRRQMVFILTEEGTQVLKTIKCLQIDVPEILNGVIESNRAKSISEN